MTIYIYKDSYDDLLVYSDNESLVGQWVEIITEDRDRESETALLPHGGSLEDQVHVNTDAIRIKIKDFTIQDFEYEKEDEEEDEEKDDEDDNEIKVKYRHRYICPECKNAWSRENVYKKWYGHCPNNEAEDKNSCGHDVAVAAYVVEEIEHA